MPTEIFWSKPEVDTNDISEYRKLQTLQTVTSDSLNFIKEKNGLYKRDIIYNPSVFDDERYKYDQNTDSKVVIIVENIEQTHYLMVQSYNGKWGFPKGCLETNQLVIDGTLKELKEETGIVVEPDKLSPLYSVFDTSQNTKLNLRGDLIYAFCTTIDISKDLNLDNIDLEISGIQWVSKIEDLPELEESKVLNRITNSLLNSLKSSELTDKIEEIIGA